MLILLDQQVPREMEWLCHGVVTVSELMRAPPQTYSVGQASQG